MSLKFRLLEIRLTELERYIRDMYRAIKILQEKIGIEMEELPLFPPVDPDLRNPLEKNRSEKKED